jgi:hypothetical protein
MYEKIIIYKMCCLPRILGEVSRTYAHFRRQVSSFAPALRGIDRLAANGWVGWKLGWKVSGVGGKSEQRGVVLQELEALCFSEGAV